VRIALCRCLETLACEVVATDTVKDALAAVEHRTFDLAFVDPAIEVEPGRDLGSRLLDEMPEMTLVLIASCTTFGTVLTERLRGVCDHVSEGFTPGQIRRLVERLREQRSLCHDLADCQRRLRASWLNVGTIAESAAMRATMEAAARAATSLSPIVLCGERGSGQEVVARFIHQNSAQANGPFVAAGLLGAFFGSSDERAAAELFGCGHNAAYGRSHGHPGLVEEAEGGTLFLGDLQKIPMRLQVPLQRLIQHQDFERVGELRVRHAAVRLVVGTSGDEQAWTELLGEGGEVVRVVVPPLRDRVADLVPLAQKFVDAFSLTVHGGSLALSAEAQQAILAYDWPGNVAELENAIERAAILCRTSEIGVGDLPEGVSAKPDRAPRLGGDFTLAEIEREHIRRVANRTASDQAAAKVLGISRSTLWRRRGNSESATLVRGAWSPAID
jgi:NtrC-family two-component system response regulator AlgB